MNDGLTNIWLNLKNLSRFPYRSYDLMAIDHLRNTKGYCLLARSKTIKNIDLECCLDIDLNRLNKDNLSNIFPKNIILCKLPHWKTYVPCSILKINDKITYGTEGPWVIDGREENITNYQYFGDCTLDLNFVACPDSDIYLAWHYNNSIINSRSMLTYKNIDYANKYYKNYQQKSKKIKKNKEPSIAPFLNDSETESDSDSEELNDILNNIINKVIEYNTPKLILHSGLYDKYDHVKSELLRYNLAWINIANNYGDSYIKVSKKSINISHNTTSGTFLSNVKVLSPTNMFDIIKIQNNNRHGLKVLNKKMYNFNGKDKFLEPQDINFFKKMPLQNFLFDKNNFLYTYTGILCQQAKRYLFNTNKIDIK